MQPNPMKLTLEDLAIRMENFSKLFGTIPVLTPEGAKALADQYSSYLGLGSLSCNISINLKIPWMKYIEYRELWRLSVFCMFCLQLLLPCDMSSSLTP